MDFSLVVDRATGEGARSFRIQIDPDAPAAELVDALAAHVGLVGGTQRAWVRRTRLAVDPRATVEGARLQQGDHVSLCPTDQPPAWAHDDPTTVPTRWELLVVGGPDAGWRIPLEVGAAYEVGRDPSCDIALADDQASRRHVHLGIGSDQVAVTDLGSTNGTVVDGRRLEGTQVLQPGQLVEVGTTLLAVELVDPTAITRQAQITYRAGHLDFNRPPRVSRPLPAITVRLPKPPNAPGSRKLPLMAAIVPVLMGGVLAFFVGPIMLLFCLMGPVMMAGSVWEDRRSGHKAFREESERFERDMADLDTDVAARHDEIIRARRAAAPSPAHLLAVVHDRAPELWERRPTVADFLTVRVGISDLPTKLGFEAGYTEFPDEHMKARVDAVAAEHQIDPAVPVDLDIRGVGILGLAGPDRSRDALLRWLVVQAAALDSPRDLAIVVLAPRDRADDWAWTRWLPHTETLLAGVPGGRTVGADPDDVRAVFQIVDDLITQRRIEAERRIGFGDTLWTPQVLLVIPGAIDIPRPSLSRVLTSGPEFGIHAVLGAPTPEFLPGECRAVVSTSELANEMSVTVTASGDTIPGIVADGISLDAATQAAFDLAPVRDVSAASLTGDVPRQALLLDLLEMPEPDSVSVQQRWRAHRADTGLGAPVGVGPAGVIDMDLRRDGPHGLAAGTTGSGKSELLQSYVAALAATYPADTLTFVLVDYKGGAAFKDCVTLPHTVGFFTDLDAHLAHRALVSLNAELRRREEILREHGAKDLIDLERKDRDAAPANLFIVFDEFAFLKKEVPEFVAGVIDIAQRGRSLGVHLMLATQRPSGVVDDHIRANTNLRIALRIADEVDSNDVIDRPDAAHIPKSIPGRGYIRTGHSDVQLVQTAYGGARSAGGPQTLPTKIVEFPFASGLRTSGAATTGGDDEDERPTDLQRLVEAIVAADTDTGVPAQPLPWLAPLPDHYELGVLSAAFEPPAGATELCAPLGLVDLPDQQAQAQWPVDLGAIGHLLIYGTSGSGKTTTLRTLAAALASRLWPSDLHLYGLDFASRGLRSLEDLPHCGGVVNADEIERTERLFVMLEQLVVARKAVLGAGGASSLSEHRAAHGPVLPYVVVLLDGYAGFHATFINVDHGELLERLARLVGEGRSVGVHVVITADRRNAIPSTLSGAISERLVLRMADADEYATLGLPMSAANAELAPGRGFVDDAREVQVAVMGADTGGAGQSEAIATFGARLRAAATDAGTLGAVAPIILLPDHVRLVDLAVTTDPVPAPHPTDAVGAAANGRAPVLSVPIGLSGATYAPAFVDLGDVATFLAMGPDRSGRTTTLTTLAHGLMTANPGIEAYLFAPRRTALTGLPGWTEVAAGPDACEELATRLADEVRARVGTDPAPMLVVLDDGDELTEGRAATGIETIVKRGRDAGVIFLVASQTHVVHRTFGGWMTEVRKAKHGLFLAPDIEIDGELLGTRLPRKTGRTFPLGRAYVIRRGLVDLTQVATP